MLEEHQIKQSSKNNFQLYPSPLSSDQTAGRKQKYSRPKLNARGASNQTIFKNDFQLYPSPLPMDQTAGRKQKYSRPKLNTRGAPNQTMSKTHFQLYPSAS